MKKAITLSIFAVVLFGLAACQNSDSSGGGAPAPAAVPAPTTYATTPQPCNAQQILPGCIPNQPYPYGGWPQGWYWPYQWQPAQDYCGCPYGFTPVIAGNAIACAPTNQFFVQQPVVYFNWGMNSGPQNNQWVNIPQNQYAGTQLAAQCLNQTAQGCDVRLNNCPSGNVCRPTSGGSTIGLCVRGP